jgi:hypothetical protein
MKKEAVPGPNYEPSWSIWFLNCFFIYIKIIFFYLKKIIFNIKIKSITRINLRLESLVELQLRTRVIVLDSSQIYKKKVQ